MCAETLTVFLVFFVQRAPSAGAADTFRWFFWKNHHKSHHNIQNWWTAGHNPTILPLSGTRPRFLPLPSGLTVAQRSFSSSGGASGVTRPAGETHWPRLTPTPTDVEKHRLDFSRIRTSSVSKGKSSRHFCHNSLSHVTFFSGTQKDNLFKKQIFIREWIGTVFPNDKKHP